MQNSNQQQGSGKGDAQLRSVMQRYGGLAFLPTANLSAKLVKTPYCGGVTATKPYPIATPYTEGRVRGLFIGCNYLGTEHELGGCINDVAMLLGTFEKIGFPLQEACILVDDPKFKGRSGSPTRDNIINHFKWLVHDVRPGDVLILHYSGHGSQRKNLKGDEDDGLDETMVPLDFKKQGCIVDDDIFDMVVRPLPEGVRLTAIMDCCHSGSMMDLPFEFKADNSMGLGRNRMRATRQYRAGLPLADVVMFSGCADDQTSADIGNYREFGNENKHGKGHSGGACMNAIAHALTQTAGLTYAQLLLFMRDKLREKGFQQVPQLSSTKPLAMDKVFSLFGDLGQSDDFAAAPTDPVQPTALFQNIPPPQFNNNPVQLFQSGGAPPLYFGSDGDTPTSAPYNGSSSGSSGSSGGGYSYDPCVASSGWNNSSNNNGNAYRYQPPGSSSSSNGGGGAASSNLYTYQPPSSSSNTAGNSSGNAYRYEPPKSGGSNAPVSVSGSVSGSSWGWGVDNQYQPSAPSFDGVSLPPGTEDGGAPHLPPPTTFGGL